MPRPLQPPPTVCSPPRSLPSLSDKSAIDSEQGMDAWTWTLAWLPGCLPMWVCVCVCGWREDVKQASKKENDGIGKQARERRSPALTWLIKHLLVVCLFEKLLANVCPQVSCLPFFPPLQARHRQPESATPFALCLCLFWGGRLLPGYLSSSSRGWENCVSRPTGGVGLVGPELISKN